MIKTKYEIDFIIDEKTYKITVKEPSLKEKKELELKSNESQDLILKLEELSKKENILNLELKELSSQISINSQIISDTDNISDKIALLWENKKLNKEASNLNKELLGLDGNDLIKKLNENLEENFKYKSSLLIENTEFLEEIANKGITHRALWEILALEIAKAQEKK